MTQKEALEKWGEITEERLGKSLEQYKVGRTSQLKSSIKVDFRGEDKAVLSYYLYGMFVDMGVGKGKKFGDADKLGRSRKGRRQKLWYSKRINKEIFALSLAMSNNAGEILLASINKSLPQKLEL
jgi:hypothetical protein